MEQHHQQEPQKVTASNGDVETGQADVAHNVSERKKNGSKPLLADHGNHNGGNQNGATTTKSASAAAKTVDPTAHHETASDSSSTNSGNRNRLQNNASGFIVITLLLGFAAAAAFIGLGISSGRQQQQDEFQRVALDTVRFVSAAFEDYVTAGSLVHARSRHFNRDPSIASGISGLNSSGSDSANGIAGSLAAANPNVSVARRNFRELHEYLVDSGLKYKAVQYVPNVTHDQRSIYEADARRYYNSEYPEINYTGFRGFNNLNMSGGVSLRTEQPFYFPVHYMEPLEGNGAAVSFDIYSSEPRVRAIDAIFTTKGPSMTDRLSLIRDASSQRSRCGDHDVDVSYGVVLLNPGVELDDPQADDLIWPRDLSSMVLCIPDLLQRATAAGHSKEVGIVYLHDLSTPDYVSTEPVFMGGVKVSPHAKETVSEIQGENAGKENADASASYLEFLDEVPLSHFGEKGRKELNGIRIKEGFLYQRDVPVANRVWTVTVQAVEGSYRVTDITFVIVGGVMIFLASVALALWLYTHSNRMVKLQQLQAEADAERASLILSGARNAARAERELNDFIAHEIRNPVAAAMAAANFIKLELNESEPLTQKEALETAREDVGIVENALKFVNDLLRNMLDVSTICAANVRKCLSCRLESSALCSYPLLNFTAHHHHVRKMHRASTKQLQVTMATTDLLHDVMEPVGGMLYQRGSKIKLIVDCPSDLYVNTDCLRLKQVLMNLGRNSSKFIDTGFIRLKAQVVEGGTNVVLYVDDSGCGIPLEKRQRLFAKYQESLDVLNQGTGIGLYLCKLLVDLMGGEIGLDNDYDSGIPGHPGTRFVVNLRTPPLAAPQLLWADPSLQAEINCSKNTNNNTFRYAADGHLRVGNRSGYDTDDETNSLPYELPESLNVLFVDDDAIIRKLFSRALRQLAPQWTIREAASGEACVRLMEEAIATQAANDDKKTATETEKDPDSDNSGDEKMSNSSNRRRHLPNALPSSNALKLSSTSSILPAGTGGFDLIFIDMYMASVEKQMSGTDTVRALRRLGVTCRLCGLSANDKEMEFIQAGADAFLVKPFSCDKPTMSQELIRILYGDYQKDGGYNSEEK
jgi:signal transduction histidine kinase/CheY-like chemotaxis protein